MFLVTFEDGTMVVEGNPAGQEPPDANRITVENWDGIPKDKKIISVMLTAGGKLGHTISGCERYLVYYEGEQSITQTASKSGMNTDGQIKDRVAKQVLMGFKSYGRWKKEIQKIARGQKKDLLDSIKPTDPKTIRDMVDNEIQRLKRTTKALLKHINRMEVKTVSMEFVIDFTTVAENKQELKNSRVGIRDNTFIPDVKYITDNLRKVVEE